MTADDRVEALFEQIIELPAATQAELIEALIEMRAEHLGIYNLDDNERIAIAHSGEDDRLGRFASETEMEETFARYGA